MFKRHSSRGLSETLELIRTWPSHISATKNFEGRFLSAKIAFENFVDQIPILYGGEYFLKFNVHLLLHIPKFVEFYGSLWAWSAFPFESYDAVIKRSFHGTQRVPDQICKT